MPIELTSPAIRPRTQAQIWCHYPKQLYSSVCFKIRGLSYALEDALREGEGSLTQRIYQYSKQQLSNSYTHLYYSTKNLYRYYTMEDPVSSFAIDNETEERCVFSIDADNCLFSEAYMFANHKARIDKGYGYYTWPKELRSKAQQENMIPTSEKLRKHIAKILQNHRSKPIFSVGSNRQSQGIDQTNSDEHQTASIFTALPQFAESITKDYVINKLLLSDIFNNVVEGTNFDYFLSGLECPFDKDKLLLIYAQVHRIASQYPNSKKIHFHFYDDQMEILKGLESFFMDYPSFLPKNVSLNLHFYDGTAMPSNFKQIDGVGKVDRQYIASVKELWKIAVNPKKDWHCYTHKQQEEFKGFSTTTPHNQGKKLAEQFLANRKIKNKPGSHGLFSCRKKTTVLPECEVETYYARKKM